VIVDRAIYRDGRRLAEPRDLAGMGEACRDQDDVGWVALYRPTEQEFADVVREFDLPRRSVDDAVRAHQRPKLEHYDDTLFCVLRAARYNDATETVEFSELQVFAAGRFVVTVRHGDAPDLPELRRSLESRPDVLRRGPTGILHAIIERVVDDYLPVVTGIENDIDEIEESVFGGKAEVSRRVYELSREVIAFQRATRPLAPMLERLIAADHPVGEDERMHLGDVQDHALRVVEQADALRQLLQNILNVNLTLETKALNETSNAQNEEVKMISAWAAILFAPTLVGSVYGMNFDGIPELRWRFGYAFAIVLMVAVAATLYLLFKRRDWI
jgi:magnesium transporter